MVEYMIFMRMVDPDRIDTAGECISGLAAQYNLDHYQLRLTTGEYDLVLTADFQSDYEEAAFAADVRKSCGVSTVSSKSYTLNDAQQIWPLMKGH